MPRFFFDVRQANQIIADDEGEDLADVSAAEREATTAALHVAAEDLQGLHDYLAVEVRDETGSTIIRVRVSLDVTRLKI